VGIWRIESEGRLAGPVVAISEDILEYATVGISAAFVSGELSMSRSAPAGDSLSYNAEDWEAVFSADTHYTAEISGTHLTLAAAAYPTERWQIGLRYSPGMETGDTLYPSLLPGRIGIGIGYLPPGHVVSRFVAEAEMVQYSQLAEEDSVNYGSLQDIWNFRVGLEHILHGGMPMRVGAYYKCVPLPETITRLGFTIGSGASFGPAELNVAAGYEMSEYSHHDQFPETWLPNSPDDRDDYDRVKEGKLIGSISLDIHF